ncbi:MarR family transcriptional regulator [Streptomyces ipomoeae]|nr:MarR family transcriptional regulator [Streptomyces ipomoeae]
MIFQGPPREGVSRGQPRPSMESTVHRPRGWSWPGFRVLFAIGLSGPVEVKKVAELSGMSRAAVSALVGTLEKAGLVSKESAHNEREQEWAGSLSEDEARTLIDLLGKPTAHSTHFDARHRA